MLDPILIVIALVAGLLFNRVGYPPMLGYLLAGFAVFPLGIEAGELIHTIADIGITLLLFTIGLKLNLRDLAGPHVWAVSIIHMLASLAFFGSLLLVLGRFLSVIDALSMTAVWTIAFSLSFSSTVLAVKLFEDKGESAAFYAKIAIGILIVQDLEAVIYMAASKGKVPDLWALSLLLLIPARPLLHRLLSFCGHGELVTLFGFGVAFGGSALFEFFNIKGDFGALMLGVLLGGGAKSTELSKTLMTFKDLFLVGFFLSIGMGGIPSREWLWLAIALGVAATFKPLVYYPLFTLMKVRARTSLLGSLALFNHSEFGLIVVGAAVSQGLLVQEWLSTIALALAISFFITVPINGKASALYYRYKTFFLRLQRRQRLKQEQPMSLGDSNILVLGMGRVGSGAYDYIQTKYPGRVTGVEEDLRKVQIKQAKRKNVVRGDAGDRDFWERIHLENVNLVLICLTNHKENVAVVKMLKSLNYSGNVAAIARFPDQMDELHELGCVSYNFYAEAGHGFAEHVEESLALRQQAGQPLRLN